MNVAVILAGGVGKRVGANIPKQFIEVLGKPIIIYTLERFQNHPEIDAIEIVCVKEYLNMINELVNEYGINKVKWIIKGGQTFQDSVCNGIFFLQSHCSANDIVMIHMSVAPFIENDIITDGIKVCKENGNSISVNQCLLCMGMKDNDQSSSKGISRETIIGLNTPQTFVFYDVFNAYKDAVDNKYLQKLEPHTTSLMYELGKTLYFSKGSQYNIKITTKEDLDLFEGYVMLKNKRAKINSQKKLDN